MNNPENEGYYLTRCRYDDGAEDWEVDLWDGNGWSEARCWEYEVVKWYDLPPISIPVKRDLLVAIDSLLSCLVHRHGSKMLEIGELEEVTRLANEVRGYTDALPGRR